RVPSGGENGRPEESEVEAEGQEEEKGREESQEEGQEETHVKRRRTARPAMTCRARRLRLTRARRARRSGCGRRGGRPRSLPARRARTGQPPPPDDCRCLPALSRWRALRVNAEVYPSSIL